MSDELFGSRTSDEILEIIFARMERVSNLKDMKPILLELADLGRELIGADRCTVWLWDKQRKEVYTSVAHGIKTELRIPDSTGLVGYSVQTGEEVIIHDPYNDSRFNKEPDLQTGYVTREILVIPLTDNQNEIIGAYQSLNKTTGNGLFTDKDLKHLRLVASYAGKAVETAMLNIEIEKTQNEIIHILGDVGESRSEETGNHVNRVSEYGVQLAKSMRLPEKEINLLRLASPMHDIGKVAIPDSILNKPGKLTVEEYNHMKKHTVFGYNILRASERELLKSAAAIAYEHHERYDGNGYPNGKQGEDIHIFARIIAVCDVFDALVSERVYKAPWDLDRVYALFKEERGRQFDPNVIDAFFNSIDEILAIKERLKDVNVAAEGEYEN